MSFLVTRNSVEIWTWSWLTQVIKEVNRADVEDIKVQDYALIFQLETTTESNAESNQFNIIGPE